MSIFRPKVNLLKPIYFDIDGSLTCIQLKRGRRAVIYEVWAKGFTEHGDQTLTLIGHEVFRPTVKNYFNTKGKRVRWLKEVYPSLQLRKHNYWFYDTFTEKSFERALQKYSELERGAGKW